MENLDQGEPQTHSIESVDRVEQLAAALAKANPASSKVTSDIPVGINRDNGPLISGAIVHENEFDEARKLLPSQAFLNDLTASIQKYGESAAFSALTQLNGEPVDKTFLDNVRSWNDSSIERLRQSYVTPDTAWSEQIVEDRLDVAHRAAGAFFPRGVTGGVEASASALATEQDTQNSIVSQANQVGNGREERGGR